MTTEIARHADFSTIRYAQCWEDADILLEGLDIRPGDRCLSIASAGDNCLAMLTRDPASVVAVDLNPAQLACLELRVAAYRILDHAELLRLMGSRPGDDRSKLYERCRSLLGDDARRFWDAHPAQVQAGIGAAGRFERYLATFRRYLLPLVHDRRTVETLVQGGGSDARAEFYEDRWDTWRWRMMFRIFFSRFLLGRAGRDPAFFRYVDGPVAAHLMTRTRHALIDLDPQDNPYLQWILCGEHRTALPLALRAEHFNVIRDRLDRLSWKTQTIEAAADEVADHSIGRFNLSDIFEYMGEDAYHATLKRLLRASRPGARLLYWNLLVPRRRPAALVERLRVDEQRDARLLAVDKAFFYRDVVVEEVR